MMVSCRTLSLCMVLTSEIGEKEVDDNSDTWADHDPDCHGDPYDSDLMNDPTFEDGYMWSCCEKYGGEEGCKQTKHKTAGQPRKKSRHD